jgi:hypothetical protein
MQVAHEPSCRSLVHIWWRHTCEPCSVSRAFGSIKENNLQPRKRYDLTSFQLNQGDSEHKLAQACQTLVIAQVLLKQTTRTSSLKLCTPKSYWSNKKSGCMILCSVGPNHLKSLCALLTLALLSISQPDTFQTSPLWISKRVLQIVPVSNYNDRYIVSDRHHHSPDYKFTCVYL